MISPYKHPKTGVYWLRQAVPASLRELVGKVELKRSLRTKDPNEAKLRTPAVEAEFNSILEQARRGQQCNTDDLRALTGEFYRERYEELLRQARNEGWDGTAFDSLTVGHGEIPEQESRAAPTDEDPQDVAVRSVYRPVVERLLESRGFPIREELKDRLAERFYWAEREAIDAASAEYFGHDPVRRPSYPAFRSVEARSLPTLFDRYADYKSLASGTRSDWSAMVDHFDQFIGGKSAAEITRREVQAFADHLRTKGGRGSKPLSAARINDGYLAALNSTFNWAIKRELLETNPVSGVSAETRNDERGSRRRPYTRDEVATILTATRSEAKPYIRWVPWLLAMTGARVSEILNARKAHLGEVEGIRYLAIREQAAGEDSAAIKLKTGSSGRCVPLHSALIAEGFLDYVQNLSDRDFLFPGKWKDKHGNRTKTPANRLRDWMRPLINDPHRVGPNHSFRHWLVSESRRAGIDGAVQRQLTGHAARDVHDRYGPADVPMLKEALEKIPSPLCPKSQNGGAAHAE